MASSFVPISLSQSEKIACCSRTPSAASLQVETAQVEHRLQLVNHWRIEPGSRVLEIGCGQGTCTTVLATAVGPDGHIDAVDPGAPDYGAPFTLAQAQTHISAGPLGPRITWHNVTLGDVVMAMEGKHWDYAILSHCIWYLNGRDVLVDMLRCLRGRVDKVLVAEYALHATEPDANAHVLASLARGELEGHDSHSTANIRCILSPVDIKDAAKAAGWTVGIEAMVVPTMGLLDGMWEVSGVKSQGFVDNILRHVQSPEAREKLLASREAVLAAYDELEGRQPRTMDVWVASFT